MLIQLLYLHCHPEKEEEEERGGEESMKALLPLANRVQSFSATPPIHQEFCDVCIREKYIATCMKQLDGGGMAQLWHIPVWSFCNHG